MKKSPLAPVTVAELPAIKGVRLATFAAKLKYLNRPDVMLAELDPATAVAGVLTTSTTASAPVEWCRTVLAKGSARGLIVNAGNANAFTGKIGREHVELTCQRVADHLQCRVDEVLIASTGVIGECLPIDKLIGSVPSLHESLDDDHWQQASRAIMTTDTFEKVSTCKTEIAGRTVTINGFAKGSGMIEPNMATMLAFIFTDARIDCHILKQLLVKANDQSFNAITVDSDTSTSDTCLLFSTGAANNPEPADPMDPSLAAFRQSLCSLMHDLAIQVVRDGEGASKLIEVKVSGAESIESAKKIAKCIANSPLVKTAIAGEDANWGRVVMAVGKSAEPVDRSKLEILFGGIPITNNGERITNFDESEVTEHLKTSEISLEVKLGMGGEQSTVWTCDLTHEYISINADYRS